jgi:hypothetical protein
VTAFMIRGRQGGKTTELLTWLLDHPDRCVLVLDEQRRRSLVRMLGQMERAKVSDAKRILTLTDISYNGLRGSTATDIGIDDLDAILPILLGPWHKTIGMVTATGVSI